MCIFPAGFPIKILYASLTSTVRATYPALFILLLFLSPQSYSPHLSTAE
jgi:hypothetical protein